MDPNLSKQSFFVCRKNVLSSRKIPFHVLTMLRLESDLHSYLMKRILEHPHTRPGFVHICLQSMSFHVGEYTYVIIISLGDKCNSVIYIFTCWRRKTLCQWIDIIYQSIWTWNLLSDSDAFQEPSGHDASMDWSNWPGSNLDEYLRSTNAAKVQMPECALITSEYMQLIAGDKELAQLWSWAEEAWAGFPCGHAPPLPNCPLA